MDICILTPYFDLEDFALLRQTCWTWYSYVDSNLTTLAYQYELPSFTNFTELHISSFWCSNRLLQYAQEKEDSRLEKIALKRHAVTVDNLPEFNISKTESPKQMTQIYKGKRRISVYNYPTLYTKSIIDRNYELAIHIELTDPNLYFTHVLEQNTRDKTFLEKYINYCMKHGLLTKLKWNTAEHVIHVMDQASCSIKQAVEALEEKKGNVVDAIFALTVM